MSFPDPRNSPQLPGGFEEVLQGVTREVLRAQPDDVLGFITRYFQALLAEREREWAPRRVPRDPPSVPIPGRRARPARRASGSVSCPEQRSPRDEDLTADFPTSQEAAAKIQAAFRGYCTRRELRRAFSEPPRACPALGPQGTP
uniref:Sperm surface protein Sp17 n=1 Tax=Pavo cristatus TaxID=9049 RepID=A0A8C9G6B6_PAVCR